MVTNPQFLTLNRSEFIVDLNKVCIAFLSKTEIGDAVIVIGVDESNKVMVNYQQDKERRNLDFDLLVRRLTGLKDK